ncbi:MAG TPA: tRNA guanosine(34) transglycosylase Tgt [Candidatus Pacearchaeota archaeon]|nr:tRNA guanosine(34) transglycosylase Tgt [Candidatus Pacearchaeota archaeon]HOK94207.1 tRNA guanosine(34) transglycosylase Tgt [Candidatus Pacearchaeota archaeon]HPO75409.1 tRNA guanosine(34) transglycosylase Tgt [Candidatus Pacearchaeota archaeon]
MIEFKIIKKSKKSKARVGLLTTKHCCIETPSLVPVATQATVKTLSSEEVKETKTQVLISNTLYLHLRPGEDIIKKAGGLYQFMNFDGLLMTDSGGFQVFSWGFGKDFEVGKLLKYFPEKSKIKLQKGDQPKSLKITPDGVYFKSIFNGEKLFLGPKESIKIQEKLGADIIFSFDECTPPLCSLEYAKDSLERNNCWARASLEAKKSNQALFGIVHGSNFKALREKSAQFINSLNFDGFGIGGDLGKSKNDIYKILDWTIPFLDDSKPRHLLGIGYLEDIKGIIKKGIDFFDCNVPTHYARRGIAFISQGKLNLNQAKFLKEKEPLDKKCQCWVCQNYKRNYISHLFRAKESLGQRLLTYHNLYFFNSYVESIRKKIKDGKI